MACFLFYFLFFYFFLIFRQISWENKIAFSEVQFFESRDIEAPHHRGRGRARAFQVFCNIYLDCNHCNFYKLINIILLNCSIC